MALSLERPLRRNAKRIERIEGVLSDALPSASPAR